MVVCSRATSEPAAETEAEEISHRMEISRHLEDRRLLTVWNREARTGASRLLAAASRQEASCLGEQEDRPRWEDWLSPPEAASDRQVEIREETHPRLDRVVARVTPLREVPPRGVPPRVVPPRGVPPWGVPPRAVPPRGKSRAAPP